MAETATRDLWSFCWEAITPIRDYFSAFSMSLAIEFWTVKLEAKGRIALPQTPSVPSFTISFSIQWLNAKTARMPLGAIY